MTTLRILFWVIIGALLVASWPWALVFACAVGLIRDHHKTTISHHKTTTRRRA